MATATLRASCPVAVPAASQCSTSAPPSSRFVTARRSCFWGSKLNLSAFSSLDAATERRACGVRAEGSDFWQLLGGRGLRGGEQGLKDEKTVQVLKEAASSLKARKKSNGAAGKATGAVGEEEEVGGFNKELAGLTGGFPGGEKGLKEFVAKNPPPQKVVPELQQLQETLAGSRGGRVLLPPLLLPGMTVRVIEPKNPYYQFTGIVQRVSDGKAGVIFEGGNWDKLVTFKITDLERTAKGPPMTHPKSGILELEDASS